MSAALGQGLEQLRRRAGGEDEETAPPGSRQETTGFRAETSIVKLFYHGSLEFWAVADEKSFIPASCCMGRRDGL